MASRHSAPANPLRLRPRLAFRRRADFDNLADAAPPTLIVNLTLPSESCCSVTVWFLRRASIVAFLTGTHRGAAIPQVTVGVAGACHRDWPYRWVDRQRVTFCASAEASRRRGATPRRSRSSKTISPKTQVWYPDVNLPRRSEMFSTFFVDFRNRRGKHLQVPLSRMPRSGDSPASLNRQLL